MSEMHLPGQLHHPNSQALRPFPIIISRAVYFELDTQVVPKACLAPFDNYVQVEKNVNEREI